MNGHLPRSWKSLPVLATLLDADRLAELFGAELGGELRTSRLRYKPGVSAVARVDVEETGAVHWVAAFAPTADGDRKIDRLRTRTGGGTSVLVEDVPGRPGDRLAVGAIAADPGLRRSLAALGAARDVGRPGHRARLLRYNPRRRVVLTGADGGAALVTKVTAGPAPVDPHLLTRLAAAGLPVLAPVAAPAGWVPSPHVLHYPWFGDGDLAVRASGPDEPVLAAATAAGAALARLHVLGPRLSAGSRVGAAPAPGRKLADLAADLAALDAGLAQRCARAGRAVAAAIAARDRAPVRLLHGDFSADQVLVRGSAGPGDPELRLVDLDRVRPGAAADDLGGFLAVELLEADAVGSPAAPEEDALTGALLRGYGSETAPPGAAEILAWAAFHVLARSMEPFRSTVPDWRERTDRRLALAERLAGQAVRAPGARLARPPSGRPAVPSVPRTGPPVDPVPPAPVRVPETVPDDDGSPLRVRRAWPAADGRLALELEDGRGRVRAGEAVLAVDRRWSVRALPYGQDPRLPGLAAAVSGGGRVVVHRHRRRAVVETPDRFVKFLARGRAVQVTARSEELHGLGVAAGLAVPAVLGRTEDRIEFSVLPGRSLHELGAGRADDYRAAWARWAVCWPALAAAVPGAGRLPEHTAEDEARALVRWAGHLDAFPGLLAAPRGTVAALARRIGDDLVAPPGDRRARAVLHRDLHDKQVLYDGERLALLDFDTAAVGEPELDLANLTVHLDLRVAQGLLDPSLRAAGQEAVAAVAGVLGADPVRLAAHAEATRLRLACVYAFRPRWRTLAQGLLDGMLS
ncbi:hypothetical protein ACFYE2_10420 [Kocuria sp. CPCC 205300]|uniref:hypothetical protein n=1 Tax=Kocuria sabuli TaxID=3071448 RepID=UPI0036D7D629